MTETSSIGKKLKISGLLTAATSLLLGVLFAVTIGKSCGFLGSLVIVLCFLVSVVGGILFFSGLIVEKRSRRSDSENQLNSA
jgi:hypothetical protein